MQYKSARCKQPVVVLVFCCSHDAFLCEFETQQIRQALRSSVAVSTCISRYGPIEALVTFLFQDLIAAVTLASGNRFLRLFLESNRRMTETHFGNMMTPTILKRYLTQDVLTAIPFSTADTSFASGIAQQYDSRDGKQDRDLPVLLRACKRVFQPA